MQNASKSQALQAQRNKLANSYGQLLEEFSAPELRTVGNYTLGRLIGKGSFGKVYLAYHKLTNGSKVRFVAGVSATADYLRLYSSPRKRMTRILREKFITIVSLYTLI
jgi:serine/threonine protein kinase